MCNNAEQPENKVIKVEEGTKQCHVTVISSLDHLTVNNFTWEKDEPKSSGSLRQGISVDDTTITFDEIERQDAGSYSMAVDISCHKDSSPRHFILNLSVDVICKFNCI